MLVEKEVERIGEVGVVGGAQGVQGAVGGAEQLGECGHFQCAAAQIPERMTHCDG